MFYDIFENTMTMCPITFDTLSYAQKLKDAGFTEQQANGQASAQAELVQDLVDTQLATKQDITRLECKIDALETKLEAKIGGVENRIIIKLGGIMVASMGLLATLLTIFHLHS